MLPIVKLFIDDNYELDITSLPSIECSVEAQAWTATVEITPMNLYDQRKKYLNYIIDPTTRRKSVITIYVDGKLYFTGFVVSGTPVQTRESITCTLKLASKTIDILESTYIPPSFDKARGISQFSTDGSLSLLDVIRQSLTSLSWTIVDPFGNDGRRRLSEPKTISIIDLSKTANVKIPIDKKTTEQTNQIATIEGDSFDSNTLQSISKTLTPRVAEKVGQFLNNLANELGKLLTTNEYGDVVILDATDDEANINSIKSFRLIPGGENNNITRLSVPFDDSGVYYTTARVDQNGKLVAGKTGKRVTVEKGFENGKANGGVKQSTNMILSVNGNTRETRHLTYTRDETVNRQQQLANQEMMTKVQEARSTSLDISLLASPYYEANAANLFPQNGTPIRPGDLVYINLYYALSDTWYENEIRLISSCKISLTRTEKGTEFTFSVSLKLPSFYANPSVRPRRTPKPRALGPL